MSATRNSNANQPKKQPKKRKAKKKFRPKKLLVWFLITCALGAFCAMAGYIVIMLNGEKYYEENKDKMEMADAAIVYDRDNQEVMTLARENRELVTMSEVPEKLAQAFIATEDKRFTEHNGIDFWSIGRALYKDIMYRSLVEGGSTITQQLAKNMFLDADKTIFRKANEAAIALALERNKSKEEILQAYMNRIYFGNRAYGVKAAAKLYFGKSDLKSLEIWEMATLAAIPKAPSYYNPISDPERSKERRGVVLQLMKDQGYITEEERANAAAVVYDYKPPTKSNQYAAFIDYVVNEAVEKTGKTEDELLRGGYKIYTTMDQTAQKAMEQAYANDKLFQADGPKQQMQSAMVIVDHKTGGIIGMIGGRDYKTKDMNRAVRPRAPGSSFKPITVFAPAMEYDFNKYNPYTMLKDEKMSFGGYSPSNWDNVYLGQMSMKQTIQKSGNVASVWLLNEIGVKRGMDFSKKIGIPLDESKDRNLAIALGGLTKGATPLQMAAAYGAFANNGQLNESHSVLKIERAGSEVYTYKPAKPEQVMSARTAWYMTEMLKNAVDNGTGASAKMNRAVAGKTGTTQLDLKGLEKYNRDVWFAGYTPEWSAAIWMGFDTTDTQHYVKDGSARPAILFKEVMTKALANHKPSQFVKPKGIEDISAPPPTVSDLAGTYIKEEQTVKLTWSPVQGDNIVYKVFRKGTKDSEPKLLASSATPELRDMAIPGDKYEYYVVPYNSATSIEAEKSNVVTVEIPAGGNQGPGEGNGNNNGNGNGNNNGNGSNTGNNNGNGNNSGNNTGGSKPGTGTGTPGTGSGTGTGGTGGTGSGSGGSGTGSGGTGTGSGGTGSGTETGTGSGTGAGSGTGSGGTGTGSGTGGSGTGGTGGTSTGGTATGGSTGGNNTPTGSAGTGGGSTQQPIPSPNQVPNQTR